MTFGLTMVICLKCFNHPWILITCSLLSNMYLVSNTHHIWIMNNVTQKCIEKLLNYHHVPSLHCQVSYCVFETFVIITLKENSVRTAFLLMYFVDPGIENHLNMYKYRFLIELWDERNRKEQEPLLQTLNLFQIFSLLGIL